MITITRDGTKVNLRIESGVLNYHYNLKHECGDDVHAFLLAEQFSKKLKEAITKIRLESYEKGWKDAKAKVKKETWFSGWF